MDKNQPTPERSKCCKAKVRSLVDGTPLGGTGYYQCLACDKPCDLIIPQDTPPSGRCLYCGQGDLRTEKCWRGTDHSPSPEQLEDRNDECAFCRHIRMAHGPHGCSFYETCGCESFTPPPKQSEGGKVVAICLCGKPITPEQQKEINDAFDKAHPPKAEGDENKGDGINGNSKPLDDAKGNPATDKGSQAEGVGGWEQGSLFENDQKIRDYLGSIAKGVTVKIEVGQLEHFLFKLIDERGQIYLKNMIAAVRAAEERTRKEIGGKFYEVALLWLLDGKPDQWVISKQDANKIFLPPPPDLSAGATAEEDKPTE